MIKLIYEFPIHTPFKKKKNSLYVRERIVGQNYIIYN